MPEALRFRVVSGGCVECAGDLRATLLLLPGAEEVEVLGGADVVRVTHDGSLSADAVRAAAGRHHLSLVADNEAALDADRPWWADRSVLVIAAAGVLLAGTVVSNGVVGPSIATTALGLSTVVVGGVRYLREAAVALGQRRLAFVQLLVVAIAGAVALGVIEEAAALVVVYSLSSLVEAWVSQHARRSLRSLMDLVPPTARRRDAQGHEDLVGVRDLLVGDRVLVRPGERIPTDGVVASGTSAIDQAAVTGESIPIEVGRGSEVFGGTVNGTGALELEVTHPYRDTLLARIIRQVEDAQAHKGSAQRFADRFGSRYTPAVVALAAGVAIAGPLATGDFREWIYRSLVMLVVSCSCALLISVPTAVIAAITRGARDGILIRGGAFLEALAGVRTVAFDKTGTLTEGRPRLTDIVSLDGSTEDEVLRVAAGVEAASEHPLAAAITSAASERGLSWLAVSDTRADPGLGVHARLGAGRLFAGRPDTLTGPGADTASALQAQGKTVVMVSRDSQPLGLLAVADRLRADSHSVVEELRRLGVERIVMLTGDNSRSAEAISRAAGVHEWRACLLPGDKSAAIAELTRTTGPVAMVGDGINDAPALALADVGVAMGATGTTVALETADIALMASGLDKLPAAIRLARRSMRTVRQNVATSLLAIGILVTAALAGRLSLVEGPLLNEGAALIIIANGLRLLRGVHHQQTETPDCTTAP